MTASDNQSEIAAIWNECGARVKPLRNMVFVCTELLPEYIGGVYIPATLRASYSRLPHKVLLSALVIGAGPKCRAVKVGDRVSFSRLFFARWQELESQRLVGWINEDNIFLGLDKGVNVQQQSDFLQTPSGDRAAALR